MALPLIQQLRENIPTAPCNPEDLGPALGSIIEVLDECCPGNPCDPLTPCCTYFGVPPTTRPVPVTLDRPHPTIPGLRVVSVNVYTLSGEFVDGPLDALLFQNCPMPGKRNEVLFLLKTDAECNLRITLDMCDRYSPECCAATYLIEAEPAEIEIAGDTAALQVTGFFQLTGETGGIEIAGTDATLLLAYQLEAPATPAQIEIEGTAAELQVGKVLVADVGAIEIEGFAAALQVTSSIVLLAESGKIHITATDADLNVDYILDAATGAIEIAGTAATPIRGYVETATVGEIEIAGTDADLVATYIVDADVAEIEITGFEAALQVTNAYILLAETGAIEIDPTDAALLYDRQIEGVPAAIEIEGEAALFTYYQCVECDVVPPPLTSDPSLHWHITDSSYDPATGDWSVTALCNIGPAEATTTIENSMPLCPPNGVVTSCVGCGTALPAGTVVTYTGTSDPPYGLACCDDILANGEWKFGTVVGADDALVFFFEAQLCEVAEPPTGDSAVQLCVQGPAFGADAGGCNPGGACTSFTTSRDGVGPAGLWEFGQTIELTMIVTGHTGGTDPNITHELLEPTGCVGNTMDLVIVSSSPVGAVAYGNGVRWPGGGDDTYTLIYHWVSGQHFCPPLEEVISFLAQGDTSSGWFKTFCANVF